MVGDLAVVEYTQGLYLVIAGEGLGLLRRQDLGVLDTTRTEVQVALDVAEYLVIFPE